MQFLKKIKPVKTSLSFQNYKPIFQTQSNNKLQNEKKKNFRRYRPSLHINTQVLASSKEINDKNLLNNQIIHNKKYEKQKEQKVLFPSDSESNKIKFFKLI